MRLTYERPELPDDILLAYDGNIVRHWRKITEKRNANGQNLNPKYFQYLCLLFTEIYLDRYFRDPEKLLADLNIYAKRFNAGETLQQKALGELFAAGLPDDARIQTYTPADLRKLAFWSATGSGKTLLMHVNILQHQYYRKLHRQEHDINRTVLLTPNEGLSHQHLGEFRLSGISAELFDKDAGGLFTGSSIEIIDIHKLRETTGEKTVAIDAFEGNNLVLVDEGHRGTSGAETGHWMQMRNRLCEKGFSFEYSATFGQAMKASPNKELRRFLIEKPLWIFVGGSVTKKPRTKDVSDVVDILLFLARFVKNRVESIRYIDKLLKGRSGLHDSRGRELFAGAFTYLGQLGLSAEQAFRDILTVLFNAQAPGALHLRRLRAGGEGEVALHIGEDNEPFGLIDVGDPSGLCKLCEEHPAALAVSDSEFSGSLFRSVNSDDSTLNVLIGSKKFSEGWSSWRVSTMGLMNIGKKEGSQIIQLFGRGVRLKGIDFCLKRSHRIVGFNPPENIERLETLNVFGIHADYMRQFKEYLEDEGLPANEDRIEFVLPVIRNLGKKLLKTIRLKDGIDFKKQGPKPTLDVPDKHFRKTRLVVDWYPRIQALASVHGQAKLEIAVPNEAWFTPDHLAFLDIEELYFDLQMFKSDRAWYNLNLSMDRIPGLLTDKSWYALHIPKEEMQARSFEQTHRWQEIASTLLRKYCDRFYKARKAEFENEHLEYRTLTENDPNFIDNYSFLIDQSRQDIVTKLEEIKGLIEKGELRKVEFQGLTAVMFGQHLYQPLVYVSSSVLEVKPVPLNEGERDFVLDLEQHCSQNRDFFADKELYLLRNMSRGRGIGFFEAGNFYPDFILWLLVDGKQYINFIDPKGLRNLKGPDDPKIAFYKTIKSIENDLRSQDSVVTLNSFIVSNTHLPEVGWWHGGMTKEQFEERHVFFQQEDKNTYIEKILRMAIT